MIKSYNTHRFLGNQQEEVFHDKFLEFLKLKDSDVFSNILFNSAPREVGFDSEISEREKRIMITTLQWLGSPVGQQYLDDCGFTKIKSEGKNYTPLSS